MVAEAKEGKRCLATRVGNKRPNYLYYVHCKCTDGCFPVVQRASQTYQRVHAFNHGDVHLRPTMYTGTPHDDRLKQLWSLAMKCQSDLGLSS
jgi:hypothetical protein